MIKNEYVFCVGDRVTSKKTGFPQVGRICAIMDAKFYCIQYCQGSKNVYWTELYSDWDNKSVIFVELDKYEMAIRLDEFIKHSSFATEDEAKTAYSYIRPVKFIAYPEDDLEIL